MTRPYGTYTKLAPVIDEMYVLGIPVSMIAERLKLSTKSVRQRVYDKALAIDRLERRERVADEVMKKHAGLLIKTDPEVSRD